MDPVSRIVKPKPFIQDPVDKVEGNIFQEQLSEPEVLTTDDVEPPLVNYAEIRGRPYTVDYFNMDIWTALTPELDIEGIRGKVGEIEEYMQGEIVKRRFENTLSSYREIMMETLMNMRLSPNELPESKVSKIATYIKNLSKQKNRKEKYRKLRHRFFGWEGAV